VKVNVHVARTVAPVRSGRRSYTPTVCACGVVDVAAAFTRKNRVADADPPSAATCCRSSVASASETDPPEKPLTWIHRSVRAEPEFVTW
jgi:hypothetical protein